MQIYAQHVDYHEQGRGTGYITPESLVASGISGSLLNHSEHKVDIKDIKKSKDLLKAADDKLAEAQNAQQRGDADAAIKAIQERDKLIQEARHYELSAKTTLEAARIGQEGRGESNIKDLYLGEVKAGTIDPKVTPYSVYKARLSGDTTASIPSDILSIMKNYKVNAGK